MKYTIFRTNRTTFLDDAGIGVDGYKVWFRLENGMSDYVTTPVASYNSEYVHEKIVERIEAHNAILNQE